MFYYLKHIYYYCQLIYKIKNIDKYDFHSINECKIFIHNILKNIQNCGAIAIKFTQWCIPKLEATYCKDIISEGYEKPFWIKELELIYEECNVHEIKKTYEIYKKEKGGGFQEKYEIIDILGSGSIGQVYLIMDRDTKEKRVMKIKHPNVEKDMYLFVLFYKFIKNISCIREYIENKFPFDIDIMIDNFGKQLNFVNEANHLLYFAEKYKENPYIIIPKLYECSESIIIMSYEPGITFEELKEDTYKKYKLANIYHLFIRNNETILNYNHGDLHPGNWKIGGDKNDQIIIYDYGYCFEVPREDLYVVDLITDTFESEQEEDIKKNKDKLCKILRGIIKNKDKKLEKSVERYIDENIIDNQSMKSPTNILNLSIKFCGMNQYKINPLLIQFFVILIQSRKLYNMFNLAAEEDKKIPSYIVFRERYIDILTICNTYDIFTEYREKLEKRLNKKQIKIDSIFDTIKYDNEIERLALDI